MKNCNTPNMFTYTLQIVISDNMAQEEHFIIAWFAVVFGVNCSHNAGRKE